jgi:hypothetical protein
MEILSKIFEVLNNKISLPVAIFCGFLLLAPNWVLQKMDILAFVTSSRTVISLAFLFSTLVYGYEKGKKVSQFTKEILFAHRKRRAAMKAVIARLDGVTPQEEAWIFYCLKKNTRTLIAMDLNDTAVSLENKLLVDRPSTIYNKLAAPFTLREEVWAYLMENREKYCPPEKLNDPEYNRRVDQFIGSLRSVM